MRPNDGRALPTFIGQALKGKDITVFGDGTQTRSFCYVTDLIEGIFKLLLSEESNPVNIGNPDEIKVIQLAEEIIEITKSKSKIIFNDLPMDDPKIRQPDITRAMEILDWKPLVKRNDGLRYTLDYFGKLNSVV